MLAKLVFNYMIELTTGIAFLVSSLYGPGQAQAASVPVTPIINTAASTTIEQASTTEARFLDSKAVESYVSKQYADEPVLVDIARCESTFRQFGPDGNVIRGKVNKGDVGVMQINEKYHADEAAKLGYNIYTAEGNVAFAKYLYNKFGSDPWSSSSKCWSDAQLARM
jgi:hypothetical protein